MSLLATNSRKPRYLKLPHLLKWTQDCQWRDAKKQQGKKNTIGAF